MKIHFISLIILGVVVTGVFAQAQTTINPNNSNLQYQGRIDFSNAAPVFIWPGTSVKMKFTGTDVTLLMTDNYSDGGASSTNYYDIILDNKIIKALAISKTSTQYQLASNLPNKEHVIEIFNRTEFGPSIFNGFLLTGTILPLDPIATRKIEVIGDGFATGFGNEKSYVNPNQAPSGYHSANQDADSAYGAILSRRFDAQYMCTALSSTGMYRGYSGTTAEAAAQLYNKQYPYGPTPNYDHTDYTPDLMIIFLGGNDFFQEAPGQSGVALDSASFVNTYISFVNTVQGLHPGIKILMIYGAEVNDSYPAGNFWLTRWRNYMTAINNNFAGTGDVYKYEIAPLVSPYGENWVPMKANHVIIADELTPIIQNIMQWSVGSTTYDCNEVLGGSATIDGCGICTGGNTNLSSCLSTGVTNATTKPEINIYPNPTADVVCFDSEQQWELFDSVGKIVLTGEGKEISLKNLSNGVYLIKLATSTSLLRVVKV